MKNPLDSILGTIITGLILTVILFFFAKNFLNQGMTKKESSAVTATTAMLQTAHRQ